MMNKETTTANATAILELYRQTFGQAPLLVQAPGRINLIGEHTDYNAGWVLPAAIDKSLWLALGRHSDPGEALFIAADVAESTRFRIAEDAPAQEHDWPGYIRAVVAVLREKGWAVKGFNGVFGGDIPLGAGLSSSAALCCGLIFGISELFQLHIPRPQIALLAQAAEHRVGLNCGLMDQYAVLFGRKDQVICLDCQSLQFQYYPLDIAGHSLVLVNSRIKHALAAGSGYNARRQSCERVVAALRQQDASVHSLRDVSPAALESFRPLLDPTDYCRAAYVLKENDRVRRTVEALEKRELELVGELLYQSHAGLQTEYDVSAPELDLLVDLARREKSVLGARMVGGGFGGCTINLIRSADKAAALGRMTSAYRQHTGITPEIIEVAICDGVRRPADDSTTAEL
ncbi:MAG: galactokinase [Saprospirales bacterium]|nr:galactokinase [Saprospirales bacterium]